MRNLFGVSYAISFYDFDLYTLSLHFTTIPPSRFAFKNTLWNLSRLICLFYILYSLRDSRRFLTRNFACFTWNNLFFWFLPTYWQTTAILLFAIPFLNTTLPVFLSRTFQGAYTLFRDSSDKFDKDDCLTWRPKRWRWRFCRSRFKRNSGSLIFNGITFARKKRNGNYKSAFILLFVFYVSTQTVIRNRDFYARKQIDFLLPILDWLCFLTEKIAHIR